MELLTRIARYVSGGWHQLFWSRAGVVGAAGGAVVGILFFHPVGMLIGHLAGPGEHIGHAVGAHETLLHHLAMALRPDHYLMASYYGVLFALIGAAAGLTVDRVRKSARRIAALEGLLPICASCRLIRNGDEWMTVEAYFSATQGTEFTHGICPTCAVELYPDWVARKHGTVD